MDFVVDESIDDTEETGGGEETVGEGDRVLTEEERKERRRHKNILKHRK